MDTTTTTTALVKLTTPAKPHKPSKQELLQATARIIKEERLAANAKLEKLISHEEAKLIRMARKHQGKAVSALGNLYNRATEQYENQVTFTRAVIIAGHADLTAQHAAILGLRSKLHSYGALQEESIGAALRKKNSASVSDTVEALCRDKVMRKELLRIGTALLNQPSQ